MAELIPITNEFDDANDFWPHPVYDNYEANRLGIVRHVKNKNDIGRLNNYGYLSLTLSYYGIIKYYMKHRFIYECFFGLITNPKLVIDHKNNIKSDNRLENLQLITQSQNLKKEHRKGENKPPIRLRATNIKSGESSVYDSAYKCSKELDISNASIIDVINGKYNSATSKKDKCKYSFEKINCETKSSAVKVRASNITTGETKDYTSIGECCRSLDICHQSIGKILKGTQKTATSKKDKCKYSFEKID